MRKRYVLTMTAANRVGILAAVTQALTDLDGNLVEIRQTVLQGFFTMIIAAEFPEQREPEVILGHVESACQRFGVLVTLKDPETESVSIARLEGTEKWVLTAEGTDKPGALQTLARLLAGSGIDITHLHAARSHEAEAFRASLDLAVPPVVELDVLQPQLEAACERLGLVADLKPADTVANLADDLESAGKPR